MIKRVGSVTEQMGVVGAERYKRPHFFSWGSSPALVLLCPLPEERCFSMPETDKKERNYYLFEIIETKVL